jgi:hypothetical protein
MTDTPPNPPRWAQALLGCLSRPTDRDPIAGDLLEEYREVRHPALGRLPADTWYVKHVISVLWRIVWPSALPMAAVKLLTPVWPVGWIPSLVPLPNVSALDALALLWAGYYGSRRTGLIRTGTVTSAATSLLALAALFVYAVMTTPGLLLALVEKPFILVIMGIILAVAVGFALLAGALGGAVGRWSAPIALGPRAS